MCKIGGELFLSSLILCSTFTSGESIFVILRPARKTGTLFSYNVFGKDVDHARLASDRGALMNTIHDAIGSRRDIFFDEILTTTDSYQPKTRMARRFGDGRAMIAGGRLHLGTNPRLTI